MRIGTSLFLVALGAILTFAMSINPYVLAGLTIRWDTVGVILMLVGLVGLVWSLFLMNRATHATQTTTYVDDAPVVGGTVQRDTYVER